LVKIFNVSLNFGSIYQRVSHNRVLRMIKRTIQVWKTLMRFNIEALFEVRSVHSSDEAFVMKVERRDWQLNCF